MNILKDDLSNVMSQIIFLKSVASFTVIRQNFPFLSNPKSPDLSFKTDLDLWDCFWKKKNSI